MHFRDEKSTDATVYEGWVVESLFDDLDGARWTLAFASSADQAFFNLDWRRFAAFDFVDAYWARVYAGFASVAFFGIHNNLYHVHTSIIFD
jgi:hypothetical protein